MFTDKVCDLPARQVSLEHQNPAIIDDRRVEALSLSADINADPRSHASSMPHSSTARILTGPQDLTGPRLPSARLRYNRPQQRRGTRPSGVSAADCGPMRLHMAGRRHVRMSVCLLTRALPELGLLHRADLRVG